MLELRYNRNTADGANSIIAPIQLPLRLLLELSPMTEASQLGGLSILQIAAPFIKNIKNLAEYLPR